MLPSDVDPALIEPQLSNRVMAALLHELDLEESPEVVDAIVHDAGLPREYLTDNTAWVSSLFVHRLATAVAKHVYALEGPPPYDHPQWQLWRRAGQRSLDRTVIGPIFGVLEAIGSPGRIYASVEALSARATRSTEFELERRTRGRAVIRARPVSDSALEAPSCWFRRGFFEGVPTLFGLPPARVDHHECILDPVRPSSACVYRIRFDESRTRFFAARLLIAAAGAALAGGLASVMHEPIWLAALAGAGLASTADGWRRYVNVRRHMQSDAAELERLIQDADARHDALWSDQVALRRSNLAARKLSGYLASDLVEQILGDPELELTLGGTETEAAVLFSDIVGFTPRCERLDAAEVVEQLNLYFSHVDRAFADHRGVIDKRMGDGIMAVFVPLEDDDTPVGLRALRSALDILRHLEDCNVALSERGAEPFQIRVGVASGQLVQGNMGSPVKLEYTVIGDVVNLAARLEGQARPDHLLAPSALVALLTEDERAELEIGEAHTIAVKGRAEAVKVQGVRPLDR